MFLSDKFYFNGVHSDDMGVALVTFDSNMFNTYGIDYKEEVVLGKNYGDMSHFTSGSSSIEEKTLNIALIDRHDNPLVWSDETIMEISDWLITDGFAEFISEDNVDLVYYFKATSIVKNFTPNRQGYLQITVQPFSNLAYKKFQRKFIVDSESNIEIDNLSNLREPYKPILEIKNLEDNLNIITIQNETLKDESFMMRDIEHNEVITIDSLMGTVYNEFNQSRLMNCNRKWVKLNKGINRLKITGSVEITFKCLFPVRL